MDKGVFYFDFSFDDVDDNDEYLYVVYGFTFSGKEISIEDEFESDSWIDIVEKLESEYGIHDWSSKPNDNVYAIGYTTYEVEEDKVLELMNKWRERLVSVVGESGVGKITKIVDYDTIGDDFDIYNYLDKVV